MKRKYRVKLIDCPIACLEQDIVKYEYAVQVKSFLVWHTVKSFLGYDRIHTERAANSLLRILNDKPINIL
jgi:hypothetical protein